MPVYQSSNISNESIYAWVALLQFFMYKVNSKGNVLLRTFVDEGVSISLMNRKLTDFSSLSLKLPLFGHLFFTKSYKPQGK